MKDEEKNLIENLFHRLKNTELNSSERDNAADELIQNLVKKQPASSYYMAQTILIQETAIKKMSEKIEELKKRIKVLKTEKLNKKPSFLSNFFKSNPSSQTISHDNNAWKNNDNNYLQPNNANMNNSPVTQTLPNSGSIVNSRSSSFLGNALQTATGVAGGMILGNMLMNVFNHTKPEEEIFGTINHSSAEYNNIEDNVINNTDHGNLVDYKYDDSDVNMHELNSNSINNNIYDTEDDIDTNDDNFI